MAGVVWREAVTDFCPDVDKVLVSRDQNQLYCTITRRVVDGESHALSDDLPLSIGSHSHRRSVGRSPARKNCLSHLGLRPRLSGLRTPILKKALAHLAASARRLTGCFAQASLPRRRSRIG